MSGNAVLDGLKKGDRFSYDMLKYDRETTEQYWNWWWSKNPLTQLNRPYTICDGDPLLTKTFAKSTVDTKSDADFFSDIFIKFLSKKPLPKGEDIDRAQYRESVAAALASLCEHSSEPTILFTGGGYGGGKTDSIHFLVAQGLTKNSGINCLQGVDICKQFIPEFHLLKRVSDGRASEMCQDESRMISDNLFRQLIDSKKSFGWDSSMSDFEKTKEKIELARSCGYRLEMLAVFVPIPIAIQRAMHRAKLHRRFPHPDYLPLSHQGFAKHFTSYIPLFDTVTAIDNQANKGTADAMLIIGEKLDGTNFEIVDDVRYRKYVTN